MYGNTGKILDVDLSQSQISVLTLEAETYKSFAGGSGLAAKLFFDRGGWRADPFAPESPLIFMSGPLTGLRLDGASRSYVGGGSPLTGIWGDAACGGNFGAWCKYAGYDGIIIVGQAGKPVYLLVTDNGVEIKDAAHLWGKDTYDATDALKKVHSELGVKVVTIGIAGENRVRFSSIHNDKAHAFARTGLGAVMGAKRLKAIAVGSSKRVFPVARPEEYQDIREKLEKASKESAIVQMMGQGGTAGSLAFIVSIGDAPTKNWQTESTHTEAAMQMGQELASGNYLKRRHACWSCSVACKRVHAVPEGKFATVEGPGPEYETVAAFGTMTCNYDLASIIKINEMANRYGVDSISCGSVIAWAIECFEKGILTTKDTDGLWLEWGKPQVILALLDKIAKRQDIGNILAEGSLRSAKQLGRDASACLTCVKGMEAPMHDPRALYGMGLAYATSIRGACHVSSADVYTEQGGNNRPELGMQPVYEMASNEHKPELASITADLGAILNSIGLCHYPAIFAYTTDGVISLVNSVAGYDWDINCMMKAGQRIWFLKRSLGHLMGATARDDHLPARVLAPLQAGPTAGNTPDMDRLLSEFYRIRELDPISGRPSKNKLENLGLKDIAECLAKRI